MAPSGKPNGENISAPKTGPECQNSGIALPRTDGNAEPGSGEAHTPVRSSIGIDIFEMNDMVGAESVSELVKPMYCDVTDGKKKDFYPRRGDRYQGISCHSSICILKSAVQSTRFAAEKTAHHGNMPWAVRELQGC